ncbi:MAG: hypothetical protein WAV98_02980 [Minisyncoccia bacterium]
MSTFALHLNTKKLPKVLSAFELVRGMSESELETLEILSDAKNVKLLELSIGESKKNKVSPIETIL